MSDNVIQFPQSTKQTKPSNTTWSFEMEDHTGSIFTVSYDTEIRELEMVKVSDGYIEHLCEILCSTVRSRPELNEYVASTLERMIKQISG